MPVYQLYQIVCSTWYHENRQYHTLHPTGGFWLGNCISVSPPPHPPPRFPPEQQLGGWERRQSPLLFGRVWQIGCTFEHSTFEHSALEHSTFGHCTIKSEHFLAHIALCTPSVHLACKFCTYLSEIVKWLPRALIHLSCAAELIRSRWKCGWNYDLCPMVPLNTVHCDELTTRLSKVELL